MPKYFIPASLDNEYYQINTPNEAYPVAIRGPLGVLIESELDANAEITDIDTAAEYPLIRLRLRLQNGRNLYRFASTLGTNDYRDLIGRAAFGSTIRAVKVARRRVRAA